ncbi:MAG: ParB/RepB/Spo0J family partition protein [Anaerolineales bacterium]
MPGLGKGLDALIPTGTGSQTAPGGVSQVPVARIRPNPRQPRAVFKPEDLAELADSIREHGIIQPLIVTRGEDDDYYTLIAGERRLQAAKQVGLGQVPAIVRTATDQQRLELALIENIQRADLNALEEAHAYQSLLDEFGLAHDEIARRVGKSRVTVTNTLRLLKLPNSVQKALLDGQITEGHARALLGLEVPHAIELAMEIVVALAFTVRQTEGLVRVLQQLPTPQSIMAALVSLRKQVRERQERGEELDITLNTIEALVRKMQGERPEPPRRPTPTIPPDLADLEGRIAAALGNRATLRVGKNGKGTLTLHFFSNEELENILSHILKD